MWKHLLLCLNLSAVILLSSCGGYDQIAVEMRPRIIFLKETVRVTFPLEAAYTSEIEKTVSFGDLGSVFLKYDAEKNQSQLGVQIVANRKHINQSWPSEDFMTLPRAMRFSKFFRRAGLKVWMQKEGDLTVGLLYSPGERLYIGGFVSSEDFRSLGTRAYAYQRFRAANHGTTGMIAALGPDRRNSPFPGGLFFLSDFGLNPFGADGE